MDAVEQPMSPGWMQRVLIGRNPRNTVIRIVALTVTCFVVFRFVLLPIRIFGPSMLPTYRERGINFINCAAYWFTEPKRGDVVGVELAGHSVMYLKRIIALPGETLEFREGRAYVDGKLLDEPYVKFDCDWDIPPEHINAGWYYVVGDNRSMPEVLHEKGRVRRSRIVGKILLCQSLFESWLSRD
jgi:signal peptidase I